MKTPSHRDRLIASLPADMQAGAMEACHIISDDGNDPVVGMFAVDIESTQRGFANQRETTERSTAQLREEIRSLQEKLATADEKLRANLAESEEREKQLPAHVTKCHTETRRTIQEGYQKLTGDRPWRRGMIKSIASGITLAVGWVIGSLFLLNAAIGKLQDNQNKTLAKISENPEGFVDFANASMKAAARGNDTAAMLAGISALLATPDALLGVNDGKLIIKVRSENVEVKTEDGYTTFRIHKEYPDLIDRIEDHIDAADKALQEK